ncbi:hypothetical protein [Xylocopilactobacillus apicola]|uniref:LXG domain-containing protein n=1 Tax=Xylocopilactobacillus apicola TaxID=2932184 RepID=A0AAU9DCP9_9LACO|nr:hypothetical protein [Xylocopilactobacillus apicola]BDR59335.1 hypothetical protein XA3_17760 [Xylocopilactobacillus apicola]
MLLAEAVEKAVQKFPDRYQAEVDHGDLDEAELEGQIARARQLMKEAQNIVTKLSFPENSLRVMSPNFTSIALFREQEIADNKLLVAGYERTIKELEIKLGKLRAFNAKSSSIFKDIDVLKQAVDQGLEQTKTSWDGIRGVFLIPDNLDWANTIQTHWQQYEREHADKFSVKVIKHEDGVDDYLVYRNGELDQEATIAYNEIKLEEDLEYIKEKINTTKEALERIAFLTGTSLKMASGEVATITGIVGILGVFGIVEVATGGTATVFVPELAGAVSIATNGAVAVAGAAVTIDGWNSLKEGYQGNIMTIRDRPSSKTFGQPIEGRIGNHKYKIRVDAEPDSNNKIQIQAGGGKSSRLNDEIKFEKITDKSSIYDLIPESTKRLLGKNKINQLVNNIWKAFIWLKTK